MMVPPCHSVWPRVSSDAVRAARWDGQGNTRAKLEGDRLVHSPGLTVVEEVKLAVVKANCPMSESKKKSKKTKVRTDELLRPCLSIRAVPLSAFRAGNKSGGVLPITSINDAKLFDLIGLTEVVNHTSGNNTRLADEHRSKMMTAIYTMQQRTADWMVCVYIHTASASWARTITHCRAG